MARRIQAWRQELRKAGAEGASAEGTVTVFPQLAEGAICDKAHLSGHSRQKVDPLCLSHHLKLRGSNGVLLLLNR
jgi:hypothetical protein